MKDMEKIALLFPGIGYHTDKPLLYYSKGLAAKHGYRIIEVSYSGFPANVKGDAEKMKQCFQMALEQTEEILKEEHLQRAELLVLAKSVGTAVAAAYLEKYHLTAKCVYYTPVEQSFQFIRANSGIAFTGTADPWVETEIVKACCEKMQLPLTIIPEGNHSLETGDVFRDLEIIQEVMEETEKFL
ncbi:MAG: alpha/beta hydrolase [Lachnospiraceae bacterium]|nr:alpha/beta hydrolase [Lachnospiraceae bacterium]